MQWEDLKNKSKQELKELLSETRHELQNLYFQAHSRQLKQVHKINLTKKTIARISMLLKTKTK
jgi:large subunit ribosomal protein L29